MQLIPLGLSWSCSALVRLSARLIAPRTTSLAGALWTPRVSSLRAQIPAMWPGRRHELRLAGQRVEDLDPRPVEGRVLAVVAGLVDPPLLDLLGVEPWRRVEDGDAVAHQLAVGDHRELDGLQALQVDHALLVHGHQVGDGEHRDLVDGLEAGEAGAVGGVADVVVGGHARRDRGGAAGEGGRARRRGRARPDLLDRDRLRLRLDHRRDVLLALRGRQVVERLDLPAAALDDELERALVGRRLDVDGDVVAVRAGLEGGDLEGGLGLVGELATSAVAVGHDAVGAHAHDVRGAAAVEEVAVDRVREVGALQELPERGRELVPVRDQRRRVGGAAAGESDERGDGCARRPRSDETQPPPPRRRRRARDSSACVALSGCMDPDVATVAAAGGRNKDREGAREGGHDCPNGRPARARTDARRPAGERRGPGRRSGR